jgi:hypothetical protein
MQLRRDISILALALTCIAGSVWACSEAPAVIRRLRIVHEPHRPSLMEAESVDTPAARHRARERAARVDRPRGRRDQACRRPIELPVGDAAHRDAHPARGVAPRDGSVRATLDDRWADFAVVKLGTDGKPQWTCVHGPQGAAQFLRSAIATAPVPTPGTVWEVK